MTPLPHVAVHIEQPKRVRFVRTGFRRMAQIEALLRPEIGLTAVQFASEMKKGRRAGSASIFAFGLSG